MPNVNRVFGLRPTKSLKGYGPNGQIRKYFIPATDATAVMVGDVVKITGAADAQGVAVVTRLAANTDVPLGVVMGIEILNGDINPPSYRKASVGTYVWVDIDPDTEYEVQGSGTFVYATDVGLNVGLTFTAGSVFSGNSGMQADLTTKAVTATLPLKITGVVQRMDADFADTSNVKLKVKLANHAMANAVAGV
jgi:hypothetical protein